MSALSTDQVTTSIPTFGDRFLARSREHGRLCVGIDPHTALLEQWGLAPDIVGLQRFTDICVEAFADVACVVKPQIAFYESYGSAGYAVLENALSQLSSAGALVLSDAKRGDIGSTMAGYGHAWLSPGSSLESDAVTVSPFLGYGSLSPVLELAEQHSKGVIILAATSNPEGSSIQCAHTDSGLSLSQLVVDSVKDSNKQHLEERRCGNVGVVIGATVTQKLDLTNLNGMILLPGLGAQGGTAEGIRTLLGNQQHLGSPNVSRAILQEGPDIGALRSAVERYSYEFMTS